MKLKILILSFLYLPLSIFSYEQLEKDVYKILVYNTHGLPEVFINDNPKMRFPIIGDKTKDYDISLIQEDYSHHDELSSGLSKDSLVVRGPMGGTLSCPFCTGSGLTSILL